MTGYTPIPAKLWSQAALHRLYDDVAAQPCPERFKELLQTIQELELEVEEERERCHK